MDDGGIVAEVPILLKILASKGSTAWVVLNPKKCEWSWLNSKRKEQCPLEKEGVLLVPTEEICILGVPLGSSSWSAAFVKKGLFSRVKVAMERLKNLNGSQSALYLLRVSYRSGNALHANHTTGSVETTCS